MSLMDAVNDGAAEWRERHQLTGRLPWFFYPRRYGYMLPVNRAEWRWGFKRAWIEVKNPYWMSEHIDRDKPARISRMLRVTRRKRLGHR